MSDIKRYNSAYPGSMHEREDGQYVDAEDSQSLAAQLLHNLQKAQRNAEDAVEALEDERTIVAQLEAKLKVAEEALTKISLNFWKKGDDFCHPEGCESPGIAKDALVKINARITDPG